MRHEGMLDSCEQKDARGSNRAAGQNVARCGSGCRRSRCLQHRCCSLGNVETRSRLAVEVVDV